MSRRSAGARRAEMGALSEAGLLAAAGPTVFARGEDYVRYVRAVWITGNRATATVQAKRVYQVTLTWRAREIEGSCSCAQFAEGVFCRHLVAVGLNVLDEVRRRAGSGPFPPSALEGVADPVTTYLDHLDANELRDLVHRLRPLSEVVERHLDTLAAVATGDSEQLAGTLLTAVSDALTVRGFIDYRRSFEVAVRAEQVLNELTEVLDRGLPDAVLPAAKKAVTRLRALTEQADDAGGSLGAAAQRAVGVYARACREGSPDQAKLAGWLISFRDSSPGRPRTSLAEFVPAFDAQGLMTYRRGVARLAAKYRDAVPADRAEVDLMQLELADHDGDVDLAVELLSRGERPRFGAIVARLQQARRTADMLAWTEQAVAAGMVRPEAANDHFLAIDDVAEWYLRAGRPDDAITVLRQGFSARPGLASLNRLRSFARRLGPERERAERDWALSAARVLAEHPLTQGMALIEIHLGENDLDAAWEAADTFGASGMWRQLAEASAERYPRRAADLYRPSLADDLRYPDAKLYPKVAETLATMKTLYEAAGDGEEFAAELARLRTEYRRRSSLIAALDQRGL